MEYEYRNKYYFKPEKSGPGLTGDEIVTVAHPLLLAMALSISVDRQELLPFISAAINGLLHNPTDIFYTGRLWNLLYDGIDLDCSSDDFEVTAACSEFDSGDYKEIRRYNETAFRFSMLGSVCDRTAILSLSIIFTNLWNLHLISGKWFERWTL